MSAVFRRWQDELSLSFGEIARRTGLSVPSTSDLMNGRTVPRPETVALVCAALGHTEAELMREMASMVEPHP